MADKKKKAPTKPVIGYGTNVKAGKAVTKSVKKNVYAGVAKAGTVAGKADAKKAIKSVASGKRNSVSIGTIADRKKVHESAYVDAVNKVLSGKLGKKVKIRTFGPEANAVNITKKKK